MLSVQPMVSYLLYHLCAATYCRPTYDTVIRWYLQTSNIVSLKRVRDTSCSSSRELKPKDNRAYNVNLKRIFY